MANTASTISSKRRTLTKKQAIMVMVIGAILFAQAFFISAEVGTSTHWASNLIALIGIVVLIVGAYFRPEKANSEGK